MTDYIFQDNCNLQAEVLASRSEFLENENKVLNDLYNTKLDENKNLEERFLEIYELCSKKDHQINELNDTITNLDQVVLTGEKLIQGLEEKAIELNKQNQTLLKEMQVLIYKTQTALVQIDKKNKIIRIGIYLGIIFLSLFIGIITTSIF